MKKTNLFILTIISFFAFSVLTTPAHAGRTQHHRWQGVAIGLGAAIIGGAIYQHHQNHYSYKPAPPPRSVYVAPPRAYKRHKPYKPHKRYGRWEMRRDWVEPTYESVWNPAHYNQRGEWIEGHWIEVIDKPGYWIEKRIWVAHR